MALTPNYLKLFSNCIQTKGISRSIIVDFQRKDIYLIPNSFSSIFDEKNSCNLDETRSKLNIEEKNIFDEYVDFLIENELAFYCQKHEVELFPKISEEWLFPSHISNIILDTKTNFDYFNESFLKQLEKLCCNYLQFRFFNPIPIKELEQLLEIIRPSQIKSIEIVLPENQKEISFYELGKDIVKRFPKISCMVISNSDEDNVYLQGELGMGYIIKQKAIINNNIHCGIINYNLFSLNIRTFTESLHHNTCLNRKIAIDAEGNIKNCPSMKESFGNIKDTTLEEAINKPGFKKYWNITKDQITKCKDCEFRHVCTDCRAYTDNPEDMYAAPLKCGYDPYTCTWEEWCTNPLKQKAIDYYGMREIMKNE
ncbi:MAG TPA: grasp-with-spasm system SPASM domain peptide maturase [Edaphocola sp.]|nr:grasp-with-spasm system SPASM domain peptide maturase [Edaphocola sp.]